MLLELSTTHAPATDLGYLLHKHPGRVQSFPLASSQAHVYYPESTPERCTAALLLDVDPIGLVRNGGGLAQYVNDRPYTCSSLLSVAIAQVLGTALAGRCAARPELARAELPLQARLAVLPCRGGEALLRRLFEPLGYAVQAKPTGGPYHDVTLERRCRLTELLGQLYVLVPVLDDEKHYRRPDQPLRARRQAARRGPRRPARVDAGARLRRGAQLRALRRPDGRDRRARAAGAPRLAAAYRGEAWVVYGHTPVAEAEWRNRTINIDTGCVFGGRLTALRWPEREPLRRVHECVFGVLALESEPVDPRL